jgi:ribosomal protein S18 acetylase RimI-like enzyme
MQPRVIDATIEDLPRVAELFAEYLRFYKQTHDSPAIEAFLSERFERGDSTILLAVDADGAALGLTQVYPKPSSLALATDWILNDLIVAPEARGQGAGRALVSEVLARARAAGISEVILETARTNTTAQGLYESLGFEVDEVYLTYSVETGP